MVSTKVEVRLILMNMVYVSVRLVVNYSEAERKNRAPCAGLHETYLTNGWQAKQNFPDLKAVDARTFGRVIKKFSLISGKSNGIQQILQSDWFLERAEFPHTHRYSERNP